MKGGLMEIADLYAINKSDRPGADRLYTSLNKTLELNEKSDWLPDIIKTIATTSEGVDLLYSSIMKHKGFLDSSSVGTRKLNQRYIKTVKSFISNFLIEQFWSNKIDIDIDKELNLEYNKRTSPYEMANRLLKK
tara:strand:- start:674 stop:1075 length:402 start_codon:yes stop_codon:yes gene_type:complete